MRRRSARAATARPATTGGTRPCRSPGGRGASGTRCTHHRLHREMCSHLVLGLARRELDPTDISAQADVGGVEFTTRPVTAQVVPGISGRTGATSTPDGLPAPTTKLDERLRRPNRTHTMIDALDGVGAAFKGAPRAVVPCTARVSDAIARSNARAVTSIRSSPCRAVGLITSDIRSLHVVGRDWLS